jgi:hypothetical protein
MKQTRLDALSTEWTIPSTFFSPAFKMQRRHRNTENTLASWTSSRAITDGNTMRNRTNATCDSFAHGWVN